MPRRRLADAGGGQHALAVDLDHAGAAIAVGPVAGQVDVAEMGDPGAFALGHAPDRLALVRDDRFAVEREVDLVRHLRCPRGNAPAGD
jgi:hypothetical protein